MDEATTQLCSHCAASKPVSEFRRRHRSGTARLRQCRTCHNLAERCRRRGRKEKDDGDLLRRYMTELKNANSLEVVKTIVSEMVSHFGGVKGYMQFWKRWFDPQAKRRYGAKGVTDSILAIIRMMEFCDPNHRPKGRSNDEVPLVSLLSDEDLDREVNLKVAEVIKQNPKLAVDALRRQGWQVIPPSG